MSDDSKRMIAKIKKLMAVAAEDSQASDQERETALRQATKLMDKHALSVADIENDDGDDPRGTDSMEVGKFVWKPNVVAAIAQLYGCFVYRSRGPEGTFAVVTGRESARISVFAIAGWVISSIENEARKTVQAGGGRRDSFKKGATQGVWQTVNRLMAERARGETIDNPGQALMVVESYAKELAENEAAVKAKVKLSKSRAVTVSSRSAFSRGKEYGRSVNLSRQVGGKTAKRLK